MRKITVNKNNIDYISEYNDMYIIYFNGGRYIEVPKEFEMDMIEAYLDLGRPISEKMKGKMIKVNTITYIKCYQTNNFVTVPLYEVENAD